MRIAKYDLRPGSTALHTLVVQLSQSEKTALTAKYGEHSRFSAVALLEENMVLVRPAASGMLLAKMPEGRPDAWRLSWTENSAPSVGKLPAFTISDTDYEITEQMCIVLIPAGAERRPPQTRAKAQPKPKPDHVVTAVAPSFANAGIKQAVDFLNDAVPRTGMRMAVTKSGKLVVQL